MKKIIILLLSFIILCSLAACGQQNSVAENTAEATAPETTAAEPTTSAELEETIRSHDFEGVIYAVRDGKVIAAYADGKLESGEDITIDASMPIGSVSKQFCAAAVMLLQDQGKLSVNDKLDKYYPDYPESGRITLHDLLSMRSGIPELTEESGADVTLEHTEEENLSAIKH